MGPESLCLLTGLLPVEKLAFRHLADGLTLALALVFVSLKGKVLVALNETNFYFHGRRPAFISSVQPSKWSIMQFRNLDWGKT